MGRWRRTLLPALAFLFAVPLAPPAVAVVRDLPPAAAEGLFRGSPPDVSARTWILYDATYDRVLAEKNPDERRAMASTTKIMTALVAADRSTPLERVTVSEEAAGIGEAEIGLVADEVLPMRVLVEAMLIRSANDAAMAVAEHVGGTVEGFVKLMNDNAAELGLENTRFSNPHGLDAPDHYSSARDLLTMARALMADEELAAIVSARVAVLPPDPEGNERIARTTNQLLYDYAGANGVKTGFTDDAGWTLVASAERDGRMLYAVVMDSIDARERFSDAASLLDYGFGEFGVVEVIVAGVTYARRRLPEETEEAAAADSYSVFANRDDAESIVLAPRFGDRGAEVVAILNGVELATVPLEAQEPRPLPGLKQAFAWASRYWDWIFGNE